jgi:hypothetical protein
MVVDLIADGIPCIDINLAVGKLNKINKNAPKLKSAFKTNQKSMLKGRVILPPVYNEEMDEGAELDPRLCKVCYSE